MKTERITLMYHDVLNDTCQKSGFQKVGALQYTISSTTLDSHLKLAEGKENIQFSFDDGGCSFYSVIADMLEFYGRRGIFYITTSCIDKENFLTQEHIKELDQRGHIIASHSHSHPIKISALTKEQCLEEWVASKSILEQIVGHEVLVASVPGGAVSDMVLDCMIEAGYKTIYTSEPTTKVINRNGASIIGRYGIKKTTSMELYRDILTNSKRRRKMLLNHKILGIAKHLFGSYYNDIKQLFLKFKRLR
jgi:peptidoglycan/xylan/chitin deacetylase (PgdA/CDA1 family)